MRRKRPNLGAVPDAQARRLLALYAPIVRGVAKAYPHAREELEAAGNVAVLEAFVTHDASRSSERTWVRRIVTWRVADEVRDLEVYQNRDNGAGDDAEELLEEQSNGIHDPERLAMGRWAVEFIADLSPRHQSVVDGRMRSETFEEIGRSLGIGASRTHECYKRALDELRKRLDDVD